MSSKKLAILGGSPVRTKPFGLRQTIMKEERDRVNEVLDKGDISMFFGSPGKYFMGGPYVKSFEKTWAEKYNHKHAITVNSWTTGLMTCIGAIGIEPGDEVICAPYSMSATATAILFYGGIPVFVDIEPETFNVDPAKIEALITPRTRAIMLVHLFGHPAEMDTIMKIAKKHNLKVIEDAAHAPGVKYKGKYVGCLADIGGFSLNYHKHIHTGEGGVIVTDNDDLALRCQMIRNHGENVIDTFQVKDQSNCIGSNYRLTEIQAAIGEVQLTRLPSYITHRNKLSAYLSNGLSQFEGITTPVIKEGCEHAFYVYSLKFDEKTVGVPREKFVNALTAELPNAEHEEQTPFTQGYVRPLYLNPVYQKQIAIGKKGFPFSMNPQVKYDYRKGLCPVTERMHEKELISIPLIREAVTTEDLNDIVSAFEKVFENISELRNS